MGWKFNEKELRKIYRESNKDMRLSYKEFKKAAEKFANQLIANAKKESKRVKKTIKQ